MVAGCALGATSGWNFGNLGGIASELADAYGVGLATIGLLTTAMVMTHLAIQIPGGKASDRFGPARAGALALAVLCAGNALALARAGAGRWPWRRARSWALAPASPSSPAARSCASRVVARSDRGCSEASRLLRAALALAAVPQLEEALGWRAPYWTSIGLALLALAAVFVLAPAAAQPARPAGASSGVLRDRGLHRLAILYAASYGLGVVLANWVVELLQRHGDMSDGAAAAVGALTLLLVVVSRPLGGWILLDRPRQTRAVVSASLVAGPAGTLALLAADPAWLAVLGAVLVGLAAGIPFSPAFTGAAATRPDAPAAAVGFVNAAANLVVLVGTPLVGLGFSLPGDGRLGFAVLALLWGAALAALPSQVALGVRTAASP